MRTNRTFDVARVCVAVSIILLMAVGLAAFSQALKIIDSSSVKPVIEAAKDSLKAMTDSNQVIKKQIVQVQDNAISGNQDLRVEVRRSKALFPIIDRYVKYKQRVKLDISEIKKESKLDSISRSIVPIDSSKTNPKPKKRFRIFH